jgi:hypothetical protein
MFVLVCDSCFGEWFWPMSDLLLASNVVAEKILTVAWLNDRDVSAWWLDRGHLEAIQPTALQVISKPRLGTFSATEVTLP